MSHSSFQASSRARFSGLTLGSLLANLLGTSVLSIVAVPVAFAAAPTCNGLTATIYVDVGDIIVSTVPGDNGDPYTGTLTGTNGADVIVGTTGGDTITGANGNDTICGLDGADIINAGNGDNWIDAGDGTNNVTAGTGDDTVFSGPGDDSIDVGNGANTVNAGEGHNSVTGGTGIDTITTGGGNDTIIAGNGNNVIDAGNGNNSVTAGTGDDTVTTGNGSDTINVGNGTNTVSSGDGNDSATGGSGVDTFNLGGGTDFCSTGNGADFVTSCEANGNEGVITIVKDTTPDTPGQSFSYTGTVGTFSLAGEASQVIVLSGGVIYTAIETAVPGWTLDSITCTADTGTSGAVGTATATINLQQGDFITCTFASSQSTVATTTALVSSLNPSIIGNSVTFTATVTGTAPTGTVTFYEDATPLTTVAVSALSATGSEATYATSALAVGSHNITATYSGDGGNLTSTSTPVLVQVVNQSATTTVTLSAPNPSIIGTNVDFVAQIAGVSPTGTVKFYDGASELGTVALANATSTGAQAFYSTSNLAVGSHDITAVYSGDTNNLETASPTLLVHIVDVAPTSTVVLSSLDPSVFGDSVTFTATVTGVGPTGTITFKEGATTLAVVAASAVNASDSEATYTSSGFTAGVHSITAEYSGDSNNAASTSVPYEQNVDPAPTTTSAEETALKDLSGNGLASRFAHLMRYLTNQGSLFANLAPGSFGGSPIGNGDLTAEQLNVICGLQDSVESLDAGRAIDMLAIIHSQLWSIDPDTVRAALRDASLCGGEDAVEEQVGEEEEAEVSTNASIVAGVVPVDSEGVPLSTDPVWNACIRQFELRLPGEWRPLSCRKYHEGHLWEHPDLLVNIKFYDRHTQKLELPRGFIAVTVASAAVAGR